LPEADAFIASMFEKVDDVVTGVELDGDHVRVHREHARPVRVGIVRRRDVHAAGIAHLFDGDLDFVANVPRDGLFQEDAIALCREAGVGWGGLADAMRAFHLDNPGGYTSGEMGFVLAGLHRHSYVDSVSFLDSRRLLVTRVHGLEPLVLYIEEKYQAEVAAVHFALDRCWPFDIFASTNPNRGPTAQAESAAAEAGVEILRWGPTLSRLRR
jgi:hypothetical protein